MPIDDTPALAEQHATHEAATERPHFGKAMQAFVLLSLARKQSYGYELVHRLEELGLMDSTADLGALYRLLRELEAGGAISSRWDVGDAGPARRYYELTEAGHERLRHQADSLARMKDKIERFQTAFAELEHHGQALVGAAAGQGPA